MENSMNPQVSATIRSVLLAIGGAAVSSGITDQSTMTSIVGAVTVVVPYAWSLWTHRKNGIIAAAAALPDVHKVIAPPEIANSPTFLANPKVVSSGH